MANEDRACKWVTLHEALKAFATNADGHQGSEHILPLHWYVACRLVLEGGFLPEEITPRPPFGVTERQGRRILEFTGIGGCGEQTILGGLKTKAVDVVVAKEGIGPVLAVSLKGTLKAFRNLTNRMEEAVGDCTNLHIAYPALVYGFLQVLRGNREGAAEANDVAVLRDGSVADPLMRYHEVMERLADRDDVRASASKYEAVGMLLVEAAEPDAGVVIEAFPAAGSKLAFADFFDKLYRQYDLRFVYAAPALEKITRRQEWAAQSPALTDARISEYDARVEQTGS